jgi:hypothetical protein
MGAVRNISALPPRADVGADIVEPPVSAKSCREQMQQMKCRLFAYSITSSARASSIGGMVRPSISAVCALMTSSNLVDCIAGRSTGLAPLRILPV